MDRHFRWTALAGAVIVAIVAGVVSYNAGISHGLALAGTPGAPPAVYGWHRPWGFGFGFGPFLLVLVWFLVFRGLFWGGYHRRRWYYGPPYDRSFDEWHRQAHERMSGPAAQPDNRA